MVTDRGESRAAMGLYRSPNKGALVVCLIKVVTFVIIGLPFLCLRVLFGVWYNGLKFLQIKHHEMKQHLWDEFNHKYIQLSEVNIHYVDEGPEDGPLMVLIHGFPEYWYTWRHQIRHFSKKYRVIALDQRGYGHSSRPKGIEAYKQVHLARDIKELINALGYDKAIVIGHDWGGNIAWNVATRHPEVVERLISMDCPHPKSYSDALNNGWEQKKRGWYLIFFQLPWLPEIMWRFNDVGVVDRCISNMVNQKNITQDEREAWKSMFQRYDDLHGPVNFYRALFIDGRPKPVSSKISVPTLVIWGEEEAYMVRSSAEDSLKYTENGRVEYIAHASHWIQQDQPELVNQAVEKFLAEEQ